MTSFLLALRKLVKVLRADTRPRQVALGVALGLLFGLPPLGVQSGLVLLVFVLLSANLGAFLLAAGLAKALGLALAGPLSALGESLLYAASWMDFWRWLLNLPVLDLLGLDRFLAMGSTVAALGLAAVLAPVALVATEPLRARLEAAGSSFARFVEKPPLRWLVGLLFGARKDRDLDRKVPWLRKGGLIPALLLLLGLGLSWLLLADRVARVGMELVAEAVTGKDVAIDGAHFSAIAGELDLAKLVVDDGVGEGRDTVAEGESFRFDLSLGELLDRRLHVEEATVRDFLWHVDADGSGRAPDDPPDDDEGSGLDLGELDLPAMLEWWEEHEAQVRWAVEKMDAYFRRDREAERGGAGYEGRAHYVYAVPERPRVMVGTLGVRNFQFDWGQRRGPWTALRSLDLVVEGLSSSPRVHELPVSFQGAGDWGQGRVQLAATFDARGREDACDKQLVLALSGLQGGLAGLGVPEARDGSLELRLNGERGAPLAFECSGSFAADNPGQVRFSYTGGSRRRFAVAVDGMDPARASAWKRPEALSLDSGRLGFELELSLEGEALQGALALDAAGLVVSPGAEDRLLGMPADRFCAALNRVAATSPLKVALQVEGTRQRPRLRLDDAARDSLLQQLTQGLREAGEEALLAELDRHTGALKGRAAAELEERLGGKIPEGLPGGELLEKAGGEVEKKAGGLLRGLLDRGKDDKKDKDGKKDEKKDGAR